MSENIYKTALKRTIRVYGTYLAVVTILLFMLSAWIAQFTQDKAGAFFYVVGMLFPICLFAFTHVLQKVRTEMYIQIAQELNLEYSTYKKTTFTSSFLEKNNHIPHLGYILSGTLDGEPFNYFTYVYTVGSGKHSKTYTYSVIMIDLPVSVPHIIISDTGHEFTFGLPYPQSRQLPSYVRKITLEGNFSHERDVFVEMEHEIEAYQLLSPDTMSFLLDHIEDVEIELTGDKLFIYKTYELTRKSEILDFIKLYKTVYAQIRQIIPSIQKH